ncbi:ribosomal RNA small subunit methyltransferase A domain protein [Rhodococcus sp. MTM3W5.2]|nr:ribosomal RNA small subunit methyltransferase A domain protein [Rhodococcus sp. MTM3W5.2]
MDRDAEPPWPIDEEHRHRVFAVVDAAFAQRRKTLRAALATWAGSPAEAERLLVAAGIAPSARGEVLGAADFVRLASVE